MRTTLQFWLRQVTKRYKRQRFRRLFWEQLERREMLAIDGWNNVLQPLSVLGSPGQDVSPLDALAVINEINARRYSDSSGRLPDQPPADERPPYFDVNCNGSVDPLDVLLVINHLNGGSKPLGWTLSDVGTHPGAGFISASSCAPQLNEGNSLKTELTASLRVPNDNSAIKLTFRAPVFDTTSDRTIQDAFEIVVRDAQGNPIVLPYQPQLDATFNWSETRSAVFGPAVVAGSDGDDRVATISLQGLAAGTQVQVSVRLLNNDRDSGTHVVIRGIEMVAATGPNPNSSAWDAGEIAPSNAPVPWNQLEDLSGSFVASFGRTTYTENQDALRVELAIENIGQSTAKGEILAVIDSISTLDTTVLGPDGYLADGRPFLRMRPQSGSGDIGLGELSAVRNLRFSNPSRDQFTFDVKVFGVLHQSSLRFLSTPWTEIEARNLYRYQARATSDGAGIVSYSLVNGPSSMSVDPTSGELTWLTNETDVGNHSIVVRATNNYGDTANQFFTLNVRAVLVNRPPIFTSEPNVDAVITSPFEVLTFATGANPVAASVLPAGNGLMSVVTANAGEGQLGILPGQLSSLGSTRALSLGEPNPNSQASVFVSAYPVELGIAPNTVLDTERDIHGVLEGDVNGDGNPDLIVLATLYSSGNWNNSLEKGFVTVRLGNGDGTFREGWQAALPTVTGRVGRGVSLHYADVTGDGLKDLIVTTTATNQTLVYPANPTSIFASNPIVSPNNGNYINNSQLADLNGDGHLDLALFENVQVQIGGRQGIAVQFGDGAGRFVGDTFIALDHNNAGWGYIADLDGVNGPDLVRVNYSNTRLEVNLNDGTGGFGARIDSPTRSYYATSNPAGTLVNTQSGFFDDFDGDGKIDALLGGPFGVFLLRGQEDGRFGNGTASGTSVITPFEGGSLRWVGLVGRDGRGVDLNRDGKLDFVFGNLGSASSMLVGLGRDDGTFDIRSFNTTFTDDIGIGIIREPRSNLFAAFADFNRDGVIDVAISASQRDSQPGGVGVVLGDQPGTFRAPQIVRDYSFLGDFNPIQGSLVGESVTGDFDNDGFIDIVTHGYVGFGGGMYFAKGNGDGYFEPPKAVLGGVNDDNSLMTLDIDRDGNLDLAWLDGGGFAQAFGLGNGAFQALPRVVAPGSSPGVSQQALQSDDFNGDGYPDLVYRLQTGNINSNFNTKLVVLLYDPSARRYQVLADATDLLTNSQRSIGFYLDESLGMGDLNGDGSQEFFTFSRSIPSLGIPARFRIFEKTGGSGSDAADLFRRTVIESPSFLPHDVSIHTWIVDDFDRDGINDIAYSTHFGTTVVMYGNGDFTFRDATTYLTQNFLLEKGDFNGDGRVDLATTWGIGFISNSVRPYNSILFGQPDGTFSQQSGFTSSTGSFVGTYVGDFNGDGIDDLAGSRASYHLDAFLSKPQGLVDIASGDVNGDGHSDTVAIVSGLDRIKILHGSFDEAFARQEDLFTDLFPVAVELVDVDGDDLLDILTANQVGRSVSLFKHTSPTQYQREDIDLPMRPTDLVLGDINGDGKIDAIAVSSLDEMLVGLTSNGSSLLVTLTLPLGFRPSGTGVGDLTGDGVLDIVLTDPVGNRIVVLPGVGDGTFLPAITVLGVDNPGAVGVADMNLDGRLDLIVAQPDSGRVGLLFNRGGGRFTNPQWIRVGESPSTITPVDMNGDGRTDVIVTNQDDNTLSVILNRFDPDQIWTYTPTATDPDSDPVSFELIGAPGGMLYDSASNTVYWAPMPEQLGQNAVVIEASDGNGGSTEQSFSVTVSAPVSVIPPIFTSEAITTVGSDEVYRYTPNVQAVDSGPKRFSLVAGPAGMTVDPTTGTLEWDPRTQGLKLYNNSAAPGATVANRNYGQIQIPDSPSLRPQNVTVESWYYFEDPKGALWEQLLSKRASATNENFVSYGLEYFYGTLRANIGKPGLNGNLATVTAPFPVEFQKWMHVAMTFDSSTKVLSLYINGKNVGTAVSPEAIAFNEQPLMVENNMAILSRSRIWTYARSAEEISRDLICEIPSNAPGLVLDLQFRESREVVTVLDASTSKNHGSLIGTPDFVNFPNRVPALASSGTYQVTLRVEDGKGGVADQSFPISIDLPFESQVSGTVFEDLNGNGIWDRRVNESLLFNGDFRSGAVGFDSDFVLRKNTGVTGWLGNSQSTIANSTNVLPLTSGNVGHTYGSNSDFLLVVNGDSQDRVAWRQTIAVVPGQSYDFSFWAIRPNTYDPARLLVRANGQTLGNVLSLSDINVSGVGGWKQFRETWVADSESLTLEVVSLGSTLPPNPGHSGVENSFAIDDLLLVPSTAPRAVVLGRANPYLSGMPDGATAFGSTAPQGSPAFVSVTPGQTLRIRATGHTVSDGFIVARSPDGIVSSASGSVTPSALNGISQYSGPNHGSLLGVFLNDNAPSGQTPPTALDFRATGNVPGGINYTSLAPQLRQLFFIGDGLTVQGIEQQIVVPSGATRLFLANSSGNNWQSNGGAFEVQVFDSDSEPVQANRTVYVDRNRNNRFDLGEATAVTDGNGVYALSIPGLSANVGLVGMTGQLQTQPTIPNRAVDLSSIATRVDFGSTASSVDSAPKFTTAPILSTTAPADYAYQAFAQAANGESVTYVLAAGPTGMSIDSVSGFVRWNPTALNAGSNEVLLKATDTQGRFALQRFSIAVDVNTAPIITSAPPSTGYVGVPFEYRVKAQDAEPSQLHYSLSASPAGLTIDANGVLLFTPATPGDFAFTVSVKDEAGGTTQQSVAVTVVPAGVNEAPVLLSGPSPVAIVNRTYASSLRASDADFDRLTFVLLEGPQGLSVAPTGEVIWQPQELGTFVLRVSVSDGRGGTDEESYLLESLTRAPTSRLGIQSNPETSALWNELYSYDVQADGALLFELVAKPIGMSIDPRYGTVRWIPTRDQLGVQTVRIRATDLFGNSVEQSFSIAVRSSSIVPTISSAPPTDATVGATYVYPVATANPSRSPLLFSLSTRPVGMQIDPNSGVISWTPESNQLGPTVVMVRAADAVGNYSSQSYSIMVSAGTINRPPVIASQPTLDAIVGVPYQYAITASDPENGSLVYSVASGPAGLIVDAATGIVRWTPQVGDIGSAAVVVSATDPNGGKAIQSYWIDVRPANRLPVIHSNPVAMVAQGGLYRYDVIASDPDRESLNFELVSGPAGMTIDALGRICWQTELDTPLGGRDVTVRATDGLGGQATQTFTFGVVEDTLAPRITIVVTGEPILYPWTVGPAIVRVIAADDVGLDSVELRVDGKPVELAPDGTARVYFSAPGNGRLVARAVDAAGNVGTALGRVSMRSGEEDGSGNPAPEANITSVAQGASVAGFVDVIGTAVSPDFANYTLSYRRIDQTEYKSILTSTTQVTNGSLGKWDTTLLENDNYVLKLEVIDTFGSFAAIEVEVSVTGNLKLGNFRLSFEDMTIPVAGIPITIVRTYDTLRADREGDFGYGWRMEYRDTDLRTSLRRSGLEDIGIYTPFKSGTRVFLTLPGGSRQGFTFTPEIRVLPGFGQNNNLVLASPRFVPDRGVTSTLSAGSGQLLANEFGELYSAGGIPWNPASPDFGGYTLTTAEGIQYKIDGNTGLMTSILDRNGNTLSFSEYGIASSSEVDVVIERDVMGRIVRITDPIGNALKYQYSSNGNLTTATDREGNVTQFEYRTDRIHYLSRIVDPLGRNGIRTQYDANGRLVGILNAEGNTSTVTYDVENQLVQSLNSLGQATTYVYDDRGNVLSEIDALGRTTRTTYDSENRETSRTDPDNNTVRYAYDSSGNETSRTDPLGNTRHYTYREFSLITSVTNALGDSWLYRYDGKGNLDQSTDPLGNSTSFTYDRQGSLTEITDPDNNRTVYEYEKGRRVKVVTADGTATSLVVDALGNTTEASVTVTTPTGIRLLKMSTSYDGNGRPITWTDAEGFTNANSITATGQIAWLEDGLGRKTLIQRDSADRPAGMKLADGKIISQATNALGQIIETIAPGNRIVKNIYDAIGRPTELIYGDATPDIQSDNPRTSIAYDAAGRPTRITDSQGRVTERIFDAFGQLRTFIDGDGNQSHSEYDAANRLIRTIDPLGRATNYRYDSSGRVTAVIAPNGSISTVEHDRRGNVIMVTDGSGRKTYYDYDPMNRLIAVVDAVGGRTTYQYNEIGNMIAETNANGNTTRYEYDGRGLRTAIIRPMGERETYAYDAVGQLVHYANAAGENVYYEYDQRGRLTAKRLPGGAAVLLVYDSADNLMSSTDERGITRYQYDVRGRMTSRTEPDGRAIQYTYDNAGNVLSVTTPSGTTSYALDNVGRLTSATDPDGGVTTYSYDAASQIIQVDRPDNTMESLSYDALGNVTRILTNAGSRTISELRYTYDRDGRVISYEHDGVVQQSFGYDPLGRLIFEASETATGIRSVINYTYDKVGNRLSMTNFAGTTTYHYDGNDRLLLTTGVAVAAYGYDAAGRLVLDESGPTNRKTYQWNAENRLIQVSVTSSAVTVHTAYQYDFNGLLVGNNIDGIETRFLNDTNRPYAEVVEEYSANGTILVGYSYGYNRISRETASGRTYYHTDRLESTVYITDASSNIIEVYSYSGYGSQDVGVETTDQPYRFTGERRDASSGLDYLRARHYDSKTGRFISPDPFLGRIENPTSRHRYLYADAGPTNATDPSGLFSLSEVLTADYLRNTLMVGLAQLSFSAFARAAGGSVQWDGPTLFASAGINTVGGGVYTSDKRGPTYSTISTIVVGETAGFNGWASILKKLKSMPIPKLTTGNFATGANAHIFLLGSGAVVAASGLTSFDADITRGTSTLFTPSIFGSGWSSLINFAGGYLSAGFSASSGLLGAGVAIANNGWSGNNSYGLSVTSQGFAHGWTAQDLALNAAGSIGGQIVIGVSVPIPNPMWINLPSKDPNGT